MKIEEYYNEEPDKNDLIMRIVKNYREQQKRLADLKSQTTRYIIPILADGDFTPGFDPSKLNEVKILYGDIEATAGGCEDLVKQISNIDAIIVKYDIQRPMMREIQTDLVMHKRFLDEDQEVVAGTLSRLLLELRDERKARKNPDYVKALQRAKESKKRHEPQIARLEKALAELQAILSEEAK